MADENGFSAPFDYDLGLGGGKFSGDEMAYVPTKEKRKKRKKGKKEAGCVHFSLAVWR